MLLLILITAVVSASAEDSESRSRRQVFYYPGQTSSFRSYYLPRKPDGLSIVAPTLGQAAVAAHPEIFQVSGLIHTQGILPWEHPVGPLFAPSPPPQQAASFPYFPQNPQWQTQQLQLQQLQQLQSQSLSPQPLHHPHLQILQQLLTHQLPPQQLQLIQQSQSYPSSPQVLLPSTPAPQLLISSTIQPTADTVAPWSISGPTTIASPIAVAGPSSLIPSGYGSTAVVATVASGYGDTTTLSTPGYGGFTVAPTSSGYDSPVAVKTSQIYGQPSENTVTAKSGYEVPATAGYDQPSSKPTIATTGYGAESRYGTVASGKAQPPSLPTHYYQTTTPEPSGAYAPVPPPSQPYPEVKSSAVGAQSISPYAIAVHVVPGAPSVSAYGNPSQADFESATTATTEMPGYGLTSGSYEPHPPAPTPYQQPSKSGYGSQVTSRSGYGSGTTTAGSLSYSSPKSGYQQPSGPKPTMRGYEEPVRQSNSGYGQESGTPSPTRGYEEPVRQTSSGYGQESGTPSPTRGYEEPVRQTSSGYKQKSGTPSPTRGYEELVRQTSSGYGQESGTPSSTRSNEEPVRQTSGYGQESGTSSPTRGYENTVSPTTQGYRPERPAPRRPVYVGYDSRTTTAPESTGYGLQNVAIPSAAPYTSASSYSTERITVPSPSSSGYGGPAPATPGYDQVSTATTRRPISRIFNSGSYAYPDNGNTHRFGSTSPTPGYEEPVPLTTVSYGPQPPTLPQSVYRGYDTRTTPATNPPGYVSGIVASPSASPYTRPLSYTTVRPAPHRQQSTPGYGAAPTRTGYENAEAMAFKSRNGEAPSHGYSQPGHRSQNNDRQWGKRRHISDPSQSSIEQLRFDQKYGREHK